MSVFKSYSKGGCLLAAVIILLVIVALVVGAFFWAFNSTPNALGLGTVKLNDTYTIDSVGLGNYTINRLWKVASSLAKDAYTLGANGIPTAAEKASADEKTKLWIVDKTADGTPKYEEMLLRTAHSYVDLHPLEKEHSFFSTELAYMINSALNQFYADSKFVTDVVDSVGSADLAALIAPIEILQTLNASIQKLNFYQADGKTHMTITVSVEISDYTNGITIPFVTLADIVYAELDVALDDFSQTNGKLSGKFHSVSVNERDKDVSLAALDALFKLIAEEGDQPLTTEQISDYAMSIVSYLCERIGGVSTIDFDSGKVVFK